MMDFNSVDEVLDFAIGSEQMASEFYSGLAAKTADRNIRRMFEGFAIEEQVHKSKLEEIKTGKLLAPAKMNVVDLKVTDMIDEIEPHADMSLQEVLIVAMQREKNAYRLYSDLAAMTDNANLKAAFEMLAQEEARHKLRFEIEYDEMIMSEN
ncbi:MAG: ferritin family protein [candidate division Zixibacteria bacterium]|nr:ferritin family protein [candidate division Zixibacteria bacterium]MBU1469290.1 ferritin family protein [candidate division Zixibacteria bacterium]MBU2626514.1 ferritin family protein [candidate division Zixibacteria bacterium]